MDETLPDRRVRCPECGCLIWVGSSRCRPCSYKAKKTAAAARPVRRCSIDDCTRKHSARGYCQLHYHRFKTHGDAEAAPPPSQTKATAASVSKAEALLEQRLARIAGGATAEQLAAEAGTSVEAMLGYLRRHGVSLKETDVPSVGADDVLIAIATQICPWCDRGPFRNLALHAAQMHELTAADLCEMAEIPRSWPTCDPDLSELLSAIGREVVDPAAMRVRSRLARGAARRMSDAGRRELSRAVLARQAEMGPERVKEIADHARSFVAEESQKRNGERIGALRASQVRKLNPGDYLVILERLSAGETTTVLASEYGVSRNYISAIRRGDRPRRSRKVSTDLRLEEGIPSKPTANPAVGPSDA